MTSRHPVGTNVFDLEWDLLVILDACRVDALRLLVDEVEFIEEVGKLTSVGSMSGEWMLNTYRESHVQDIKDTALICRNNWSDRILIERVHESRSEEYDHLYRGIPRWKPVFADSFYHYELVRGIANHEGRGLHYEHNVVPHVATDRAIEVGRDLNPKRMIVHYNMPHLQFVSDALDWEPGQRTMDELMSGPEPTRDLRPEEKSYEPAIRGEVSRNQVFDLYINELRFVLEYVQILLNNINREKVVITADHGEALGEQYMWGHPWGWPFPSVKTVPWAVTSSTDEETYQSQYDPLERRPTERETEDFLKDMGYI